MAWIYLAALEDSQSHCQNGSDQLPIVKSIPTVKESLFLDFQMEPCQRLPSGTIFPPLLSARCLQVKDIQSISSMAAFHARISALQEMEKAWKESEADYFSRSYAWPKKSSPNSYSLKTSQPSLAEAVFASLVKLPKWGMIVDGVLYPLRPLERYTVAKGGSYWPTPTKNANKDCPSERKRNTPALESMVMMLATPTASQANKPIRHPSPSRQKNTHGEDLQDSIGRLNPESIGKHLSPRFVELLMGYSAEWTGLEDWAMQWFLNKRKKRLKI